MIHKMFLKNLKNFLKDIIETYSVDFENTL